MWRQQLVILRKFQITHRQSLWRHFAKVWFVCVCVWSAESSTPSHPEFLQESVRFPSVDTDPRHGLANRAARLVPDAGAPGVDARALGSNAYRSVYGACARTPAGARVINLSDGVDETVVVDAPLPPVITELVVQVGLGGGVFHRRRRVRGLQEQQ